MLDSSQQRQIMVESQIQPSDISSSSSKEILRLFGELPREKFTPRQLKRIAYMDDEFPLSHNRFMLRPQVLARMISLGDPKTSDRVLYIGCGLGYGPAILSALCSSLIGLESYTDLSQQAEEVIKELNLKNIEIVNGSFSEGWSEQAPYSLIFIEGKIDHIPPMILDQLGNEGRIVAIKQQPSGRTEVVKIEKEQGVLTEIPQFYANAPYLEGFEALHEFVFTN
ncbi:Protein-L-isoaspartate O-methyltransferase [Candidatus Bealeia paramacronuclearis]|uniref:Protein-L-isoaspartate O-methyltransferase n=1 Tax=Candidatus Bealeia paramacronuclearis TaxID=1921001 RepID=A0ABZ2C1Q1_9PROT|nr:Protein-L-isoaspartate O-methyltransferase [Candidatus Bealeia paramacronuclearis]